MTKLTAFISVFILAGLVHADNLKVENAATTYKTAHITASRVKGVNLTLSQTITRNDCNQRMIEAALTPVSGNTDVGWWQTSYIDAGTSMTEMGCPLQAPVTETVTSKPIFVKSLQNQNANGEIDLRLIFPQDYQLNVTEVPL